MQQSNLANESYKKLTGISIEGISVHNMYTTVQTIDGIDEHKFGYNTKI
jgi:hypothetical protein